MLSFHSEFCKNKGGMHEEIFTYSLFIYRNGMTQNHIQGYVNSDKIIKIKKITCKKKKQI